jgi:hypothetical protein
MTKKLTDEQVLKQAIGRAIVNGWDAPNGLGIYPMQGLAIRAHEGYIPISLYEVIFSHPFAKALFGEGMIEFYDCGHYGKDGVSQEHTCKENDNQPPMFTRVKEAWKGHLEKMVLEENPIDYLRRFLEEKK